ncbi:hypothetical protein [Scytonema sp. HK-05]|nr:hypothetical protein [Scytonema sp. HK-05]
MGNALQVDCEEIGELDAAVRSRSTDEKDETKIASKRLDWGEAIARS